MAAESLDSLKRWREERWDRRADRARLRALAEREAGTGVASPAALVATPGRAETRGAPPAPRRVRRNAVSRWIRPWPTASLADLLRGPWGESSLQSPVHPEWDDPGGRRIGRSLVIAVATHLVLAPTILLLTNLTIPEPTNTLRMKPYVVTFSAPKGNSLTAPRSLTPPAAPARAAVAPPPKPIEAAKSPARKPTDEVRTETARSKANDGKRVRETADPRETMPVPAKEKGNTKAGDGATRQPATSPGKPTETPPKSEAKPLDPPVTEPVARPGPLVASVAGPVNGSELTLGDLDGVNFPHSYYLEQIRDKIAQRWAPPEGMARGRQLKAVIRFRILRTGRISEQVLEEPSGHAIFDQAALRAVTDAQKFGPLPDAFPGEFLVVHFNFTYTSP